MTKRLLAALSVAITVAGFAAMLQTAAVETDAAPKCHGVNHFIGNSPPPKHKAPECRK